MGNGRLCFPLVEPRRHGQAGRVLPHVVTSDVLGQRARMQASPEQMTLYDSARRSVG
eukprot:CAMPEP_0115724698 /NCGR_PEP_ID=MMETSP0272-20121206/80915_1 /TAXON_ID=71861 /ORGANISM="Scrippsiella trochoidea, Strain CCMP3099" /LENGTH=56 /DNA_ID=CAMNT_0003167935 /DNA_START=348 /DNA_END=518 /DNA_ORIENTATION=-